MELVILKPDINSKYHFSYGDLEKSNHIFHSSNIFSAIANNYILLYGDKCDSKELTNEIKKLAHNIKLSSLLIKFRNIYLLPKPEHPIFYKIKDELKIEDQVIKPKELKKVNFISLKAYLELLKSDKETNYFNDLIENSNLGIRNKVLAIKEELEIIGENKLFSVYDEEKNTIDRVYSRTVEGGLYRIEYIKYHPDVKLYFLIDYPKDIEKDIKASIKLIEDEGLGGKRSIGAGQFKEIDIEKIKNKDFKELFAKESDNKMLLGVGYPKKEERNREIIKYYKLLEFGGYIYSTTCPELITRRKRTIVTLSEGSIVDKKFVGDIVDIAPKVNYNYHKIFFHGKPVTIPYPF
ncbi:type III-A CRISPR-associated RAMP protein Csm4 [Methanocaldococcus sp.]